MKAKSAKWQQSAGLARFRPAPKWGHFANCCQADLHWPGRKFLEILAPSERYRWYQMIMDAHNLGTNRIKLSALTFISLNAASLRSHHIAWCKTTAWQAEHSRAVLETETSTVTRNPKMSTHQEFTEKATVYQADNRISECFQSGGLASPIWWKMLASSAHRHSPCSGSIPLSWSNLQFASRTEQQNEITVYDKPLFSKMRTSYLWIYE